jgi:hypothetical protein
MVVVNQDVLIKNVKIQNFFKKKINYWYIFYFSLLKKYKLFKTVCLQEAGEKAERSYLNGLLYIHRLKLHSTQETLFIIIIIIDYKI